MGNVAELGRPDSVRVAPGSVFLSQDTYRAVLTDMATINGVSLLPLEKTLEMAKKIVELRTRLTVDAIAKVLAAR